MLSSSFTQRLLFPLLLLFAVACQNEKPKAGPKPANKAPVEKVVQPEVVLQKDIQTARNIQFKGSAENREEAINEFDIFINGFIDAVKANDIEKIKSVTYFPFDTRGMTDNHLILSYSPADFTEVLNAFVLQDLGLELDDPRLPQRVEKYIEVNKQITLGKHFARLGDMQFRKFKKGWRFNKVYLSDETIAELSSLTPEQARQN